MRPVYYSRITQKFGNPGRYASRADRHGPAGHHTGVDFGSQWPRPIDGLPVRSCTPGVVVISEFNSTMGNWVGVYYKADNVTYTYWHMRDRLVRVGQSVSKGTKIGHVGDTGNSTAPHLHVQANPGRGFDYHGHIYPARAFGYAWWRTFLARRR